MNETYRLVNVLIIDSWNQSSLSFLYDLLLNNSDTLEIFDVLIESRVNSHMLSPHCESLLMLLLILDANDKRNA